MVTIKSLIVGIFRTETFKSLLKGMFPTETFLNITDAHKTSIVKISPGNVH